MKDEEVSRLVQLAVSHLQALQDSDKSYREDEFYNNVKERVMQQELQYDRMLRELKGLKNVRETLSWHGEFLSDQLDAYKEYLHAVRNKAAVREGSSGGSPGKHNRQVIGPFKFTYIQLEKEGVILESKAINEKSKTNIYLTVLSAEPGIYKVTLHYKTPLPGKEPKLEIELRLEDMLELQHFRDPILNVNEFVVLDVRRTLLFLRKHFVSKKL
jgi:Ras GTPase-activating-like protein IQGAP2/3